MKKSLMILCLCFFSALSLWLAQIRRDQRILAEHIAPKILRFHVIANSNSSEDQEIKLKVKSYVLEAIEEKWKAYSGEQTSQAENFGASLTAENFGASLTAENFDASLTKELTKDSLIAFLSDHKEELERDTEKFIRQLGKTYPVSLEVTCCEFPEKFYGNLRLPAGIYETAQLKIGSARGHNWWCILYPKVCITKDAVATVPESSMEELRRILSREDYQKLLLQRPELLPELHLSFYSLDLWKTWTASLTPSVPPDH